MLLEQLVDCLICFYGKILKNAKFYSKSNIQINSSVNLEI